MVRKEFLGPFGIGLALIAVAVGVILYVQRGAHIELKGAILKVRTQAMDENSAVAVIDFRFANPSDYPFVVRSVDISMEDKSGKTYEGAPVSEVDAKRLFQYYPVLGQKYNETLLMRDKIAPRHSEDRMIAARFEIPEALLEGRKTLKIRIEDVDGPVSELEERK